MVPLPSANVAAEFARRPACPQAAVWRTLRGMKIATWNVNSIRQREAHVQRWLQAWQPDLLILQEIKCETAAFPALPFHGLGYKAEAVGQKAYNGVAILGRIPFT